MSPWREWALASHRGGFPEGHHGLVEGAGYYDWAWGSVDERWRMAPARRVVLEPAAIQCILAGEPVFDVGCGVGHLGALLGELGVECSLGVDTSEVAVERARGRYGRVLVAHRKLLRRLLEVARYRTVAFLEVLEHVPDDLRLLAMVPRGKQIVMSLPSSKSVGHVRWFYDLKQVRERYSPLMSIVEDVHTNTARSSNQWFIVRGVRR